MVRPCKFFMRLRRGSRPRTRPVSVTRLADLRNHPTWRLFLTHSRKRGKLASVMPHQESPVRRQLRSAGLHSIPPVPGGLGVTKPTINNLGIPVASDNDSLTLGTNGPILLQDHYLIEKNAQFNRERVPERVVHAKGGGAFGFLEVTEDVSQYTKAALFQPGTRTESVIRFSTVAGELGSPDTWRDPRGFAVKFYTSQGNYDMVGNNTPVFFVRDPMKFQHFIRSQKRRADNNLRDHDMQWDFWTLSPESAHQVTWLMGDRGIPRTWRHMNGYSSHTYMWVNAAGEKVWVKYHFISDQGIEFLTQAEADRLAGSDIDYHTRDLYEAIARADYP